jgi:hypothetical protein
MSQDAQVPISDRIVHDANDFIGCYRLSRLIPAYSKSRCFYGIVRLLVNSLIEGHHELSTSTRKPGPSDHLAIAEVHLSFVK